MAFQHKYELPMLSRDERDGRWARVREQMNRAGLDCLLACEASGDPSARYLTQVDMKGLAVFPLESEPVYLLSSGQRWLHWATGSQNWVEDVRAARDLAVATRDALEEVGARRGGFAPAFPPGQQAVDPRYGGYFGHPHVCVTLGEPRADIQAMFQVCEEAFETFKANAKPGITLGEVSRKTLAVIERAGYDWVKEPLAHSIGLNQSEAPRSGVLPDPYPDFELAENQAFGLHPWVGRMSESIGIDSGRAVRITKDGALPFGPSPNVELMVV